jgi:class 3 adenylate cyclase/tetratricopeptide (TPR) repeat protein
MRICAACGQENPDAARFCLACGAPLTVAGRREERKVVSVLFADLVGFTSRAEELDPEDVRAVLAPYWERLRTELERYGGTVEKFIGDAVMALFGAPVTREDDPERAVRAALAIRDWAREEDDLQVRIAVTTGEALVLLDAHPAEGEGMAAGDVVNTAARLQAAAPVNGVLVAEATHRATRDVIEYVEAEPVVAKGKADPIRVWEAVDARSRFGMDIDQRVLLPLVGRTHELAALTGAFDRVRSELEPQLVTLVGVPGIGKSRLVAELFQRLDAGPDLVWWRQGRALPYGDGVSFWALGEMVKAQAGIHENDSLELAREKVSQSVESVVGFADRAWVMQQLLPLVGGEQVDGAAPNESFAAWRRYLEGLAAERPLVLVFEDLHWADDGLLDFVDHLADWVSGVPLLVVGTARPELLDRRPGWGGGKLNSTTLALSPLADAEAALIIGRVLEQALLSAETQRVLLERAGGNPLYAEQFARLYVERGTTENMPLPETIHGIIAARLDGLTADEKRLLLAAAVLGKVFWSGGAAELAELEPETIERPLHSLERKGLIRRERRSSVSGEDELAFLHVLVRDVAYGQIPRGERAQKHVRAAAWIESLGREEDHAELVAHHYRCALDFVRATGRVDETVESSARVAFRRAGDRALRLGAFPSALRYYDDALAIWPEDEQRPQLLLAHARARFRAEGEVSELLEARDLLEEMGDVEAAAEAGVLAAHAAWRAGRHAEAEATLDRARELLAGWPPSRAVAEVLAESGRIAVFAGRLEDGERMSREAAELAEKLGLDESRANALNTAGVIALHRGDLRRARSLFEAVLSGPTSSTERTRALGNLAVTWGTDGFIWEADRLGELAVETASRMGDRIQMLWFEAGAIVQEAFGVGRWHEIPGRVSSFVDSAAAVGGHYMESSVRVVRAVVLASWGDEAGAERDIEVALGLVDLASGDIQNIVPTVMEAAYVNLILGKTERAIELVTLAYPAIRDGGLRAPAVTAEGAFTWIRTGFTKRWLDLCETKFAETGRVWASKLMCEGRAYDAVEIYAHGAWPHEEAVARLLAAEQLIEQGLRSEADAHLQKALAFYRAAGATRVVQQAEELLAAAS